MMYGILLLLAAAAIGSSRRQQPTVTTRNNGPGVNVVPTASAVRLTVPAAAFAQKPAPRPAPVATPRPAPAAAAKPAVSIAPAPGSAPPATPEERARVEDAVRQAIEQQRAKDAAPAAPKAALPQPPGDAPAGRSAKDAATQLAAFLRRTGRFGSGSDRVPEVMAAQRDMGVADDGIVGPVTRAAAAKLGVKLPPKPAQPKAVTPRRAAAKPTRRAATH